MDLYHIHIYEGSSQVGRETIMVHGADGFDWITGTPPAATAARTLSRGTHYCGPGSVALPGQLTSRCFRL